MFQDSSAFVRRTFLDKTHKWLKAHAIPIKYACAFALATSDCQKDLRDDVCLCLSCANIFCIVTLIL